MKTYLIGQLAGIDEIEMIDRFYATEQRLKEIGIKEVLNPVPVMLNRKLTYAQKMACRFEMIAQSDMVVIMDDYKNCIESKLDFAEAARKGKVLRMDNKSDLLDIQQHLVNGR